MIIVSLVLTRENHSLAKLLANIAFSFLSPHAKAENRYQYLNISGTKCISYHVRSKQQSKLYKVDNTTAQEIANEQTAEA